MNLLTVTFLAVYLTNRGKSSYVDNHRWEWIILSVRSLTVFEENIGVTVLQTSFVVFQKWICAFFSFTRSLIDRCQIVTDTCKNNVTKFVRKPYRSPLSLRKLKCFCEAFLFNLHFNYHLPIQKLFSLWTILPYLQDHFNFDT